MRQKRKKYIGKFRLWSRPELEAIGGETTFNDDWPARATLVGWCTFLGGSAGAVIRVGIDFISLACLMT